MQGQISVFEMLRMAEETPVVVAVEAERPAELKPLTLTQLNALEPFRSQVWIENRDRGAMNNPAVRFLRLFPARFITIEIDKDGRRGYQFDYTYTDQRKYKHCRLDEFYGREWRVWPEKPTKAQMEAEAWN